MFLYMFLGKRGSRFGRYSSDEDDKMSHRSLGRRSLSRGRYNQDDSDDDRKSKKSNKSMYNLLFHVRG